MDPVGNLIMAFGNLMVALRIVVVASMRLNRELPPAPAKSGNETHGSMHRTIGGRTEELTPPNLHGPVGSVIPVSLQEAKGLFMHGGNLERTGGTGEM